jgi:simple sugar transport system permease protein
MGLNFSIVLGAIAAQAGLLFAINFSIEGILGIVVALLVSIPLAVGLGILTGRLFNKTKGQEMITGMILGFFAKGVYELFFMYICGPVIPIKNEAIMLPNGIGINGIITLDSTLNGVIDKLWKVSLDKIIMLFLITYIIVLIFKIGIRLKKKTKITFKDYIQLFITLIITVCYIIAVSYWDVFHSMLVFTKIPILTVIIILLVCLFIVFLSKTKLGNDIMIVGQSIPIARTAGLNVERTRIIAVVISTVIAALGQIIYLQNIGTFSTYSAHEQVATFSIAALLVGGASIEKANIGHAVLGGLLFHVMFIVAPIAGKNIFGDAQIGEYFRVFSSYAVIAVALALYSWKMGIMKKTKSKN